MPKGPKPKKPYPEFPLYAHASGRWAKTIRQKTHYFGPWRDPEGALAKFNREVHDLRAGRTPRPVVSGYTTADLANQFLIDKESLVSTGELSQRSYDDYLVTCRGILDHFGRERDRKSTRLNSSHRT